MRKLGYLTIAVLLLVSFSFAGPASDVSARPLATTTAVGLGTAGNFAVLAGSTITDTPTSVISGDVGLSPSGWTPGLTCSEVTGTIYSVDGSGPLPCRVTNGGLLTIAKNDLTTAYNDAAGRVATTITTELAGATLLDGVYDSTAGTFLISGGTLTLDGGRNADSVFIFKAATALTTLSNSTVALTNGAQACNVFWQVGSQATLGTTTTFVGTVMANSTIVDNGGSTVNGRLLARISAVNLNRTRISVPTCASEGGGGGRDVPREEGDRGRGGGNTRPSISGLPNTGGAPIRIEDFPWAPATVVGLCAVALVLGVRAYRRNHLPKQ